MKSSLLARPYSTRIVYTRMNRPRNRQPRPPRNNSRDHNPNNPPRNDPGSNVPTTQQVQPGASVSIVLKADQATGREVRGIVQDLLTRGNHPRGIKVRLKDGRIGRVQRMVNEASTAMTEPKTLSNAPIVRRAGLDGFARLSDSNAPSTGLKLESAPTQTSRPGRLSPAQLDSGSQGVEVVKCPICGEFEGDEAAVSHHVQQHLD